MDDSREGSVFDGRDFLFREFRYLVKDNLSNLISLLTLKAESTLDPRCADALSYAGSRIQCIESLYDKIDISGNRFVVSSKKYFDEMLPDIFQTLAPPCSVSLKTDIDDVFLPADYIPPIGLMVGELVTNAVNHAFPERTQGTIWIGLHIAGDSMCTLSVADDGVGAKGADAQAKNSGFGLFLVGLLARQLHGSVDIRQDGGTSCSVVFPVELCTRPPI